MQDSTNNLELPEIVKKAVITDSIARSLIDGGMMAMPIEIEIIRNEDGEQQVVIRPRRIL